jgi:hypothetical protein
LTCSTRLPPERRASAHLRFHVARCRDRSSVIAILSKLFGTRSSAAAAAPTLALGAFGKHPGWNDHLDDLGLETQSLVDLRTVLYLEAVGQRIDCGAWDKLPPEHRIEHFGHTLISRRSGELLLARIWSSTDGKGRGKYPMVVAAHIPFPPGAPLAFALKDVLDEMVALEATCKRVQTAAEVIAALDASRALLRARLADATGPVASGTELTIDPPDLAPLQAAAELSPDRVGLARILYQLEREAGRYLVGPAVVEEEPGSSAPGAGKSSVAPPRPHAMRVPRLALHAPEAINLWTKAMLLRVDPAAAMTLIAPDDQPFLDVILGPLAGPELFCLRAGPEALPLTSSIPYSLDDRYIRAAAARLDLALRRPTVTISHSGRRSAGLGGTAGGGGGSMFSAAFKLAMFLPAFVASGAATAPTQAQCPSVVAASSAEPLTEPRDRYNALVRALAARIQSPGISDPDAREAVNAFIVDVQTLPGGISYLGQVERLLTDLADLAAGVVRPPPPEESGLGNQPGDPVLCAGGLYRRVRTTWGARLEPVDPAGSLPVLEFRFVAAADSTTPTGLLMTREISIGDFTSLLLAARAAPELEAALPSRTPVDDPRLGIRAWHWAPIGPAGINLPVPASSWYARGNGPTGVSAYPSSDRALPTPTAPSPRTPMQHLTPEAAMVLAHSLECRLPTTGEFLAGMKLSRPASDNLRQDSNLRDQTWLRQQDYAQSASVGLRFVPSPALGAFAPLDGPAADVESRDSVTSNDGTLWLAETTRDRPSAANEPDPPEIRDLVGNVAEFVTEVPAPHSIVSARAIRQWIDAQPNPGRLVSVIGASALSHPGLDPRTPLPWEDGASPVGYADVGFRLALPMNEQELRAASGAAGVAVPCNTPGAFVGQVRRLLSPVPVLTKR